jgi:hypothetical protein
MVSAEISAVKRKGETRQVRMLLNTHRSSVLRRTCKSSVVIREIGQGVFATRRGRREESSTRLGQLRRDLGRVEVHCGTKGRADKKPASGRRHGRDAQKNVRRGDRGKSFEAIFCYRIFCDAEKAALQKIKKEVSSCRTALWWDLVTPPPTGY